jgi:hypothetical protein
MGHLNFIFSDGMSSNPVTLMILVGLEQLGPSEHDLTDATSKDYLIHVTLLTRGECIAIHDHVLRRHEITILLKIRTPTSPSALWHTTARV